MSEHADTISEALTRATPHKRWEITTQRAGEIQRTGYGVVELQKLFEHLRLRGDSVAHYISDDTAGWVEVNLRSAMPNRRQSPGGEGDTA